MTEIPPKPFYVQTSKGNSMFLAFVGYPNKRPAIIITHLVRLDHGSQVEFSIPLEQLALNQGDMNLMYQQYMDAAIKQFQNSSWANKLANEFEQHQKLTHQSQFDAI
ncbi:hypothetical protein UNDYM_2287 [Undibacterium sp. YM2]|uniref:hypothetical protein n=1 Tax=Undibacterium sp. YM2 TaxID=2058625 RepID=UPI001331F80D|nr:hypothetical protein [Undibacterium sp. YM2]BBB66540.1 hypothetical protein UNDYM_2287 [Undibacterium sp. YM2]